MTADHVRAFKLDIIHIMMRFIRFVRRLLLLSLVTLFIAVIAGWPASHLRRLAFNYAVTQHFPQGQTGNDPPSNVVMWMPGIELNRGVMTVVLEDQYAYFAHPFDWPESLRKQIRNTVNRSTGWHLHHTSTLDMDQAQFFAYEHEPNAFWYFQIRLWIIALLLLPVGVIGLARAWRKIFTKKLRMQTNLCLHCGYNLTGVESDKCPECGAGRPLVTVSSAD